MENKIISNTLASKIAYCAELYARARRIEYQIEEELYKLGFDMEKLCSGNGNGFEEIERGCIPDYTTWNLEKYGRK